MQEPSWYFYACMGLTAISLAGLLILNLQFAERFRELIVHSEFNALVWAGRTSFSR